MNAPVESFAAALRASPEGSDARRAALLLHTVSAEDRGWLLAQLGEAQRARLQALVDELRAIGIPPAPELLRELAPAASIDGVAAADPAPDLKRADPAALAHVLAGEPAELVALLLSLGPWPWSGDLLARLGGARQRQVLDILAVIAPVPERPASSLDTRLLALVEARVTDAAATLAGEATRIGPP
ncbi:MAG TPA: hypothetical protein VF457_14555, partial [Burkholderiaceae bacterium]